MTRETKLSREVLVPVNPWKARAAVVSVLLPAMAIPLAITIPFVMFSGIDRDAPQVVIHEELPATKVTQVEASIPANEAPRPPRPPRPLLVFESAKRNYIKLKNYSSNEYEATEVPEGAEVILAGDPEQGEGVAYIELTADDAPADLRPWLDREIVVDETCTTRVEKLRIVSRLTGDLSYAGGKENADVAEEVFRNGFAVYAGVIGDCQGRIARSSSSKPSTMAKALKLGKNSESAVRAAKKHFLTTAPALAAQESFEREYDGKGPWVSLRDLSVHAFTTDKGDGILVVNALVGEGCGSFEAGVFAVYELSEVSPNEGEGGAWFALGQLLSASPQMVYGVRGAIDTDDDGTLELELHTEEAGRTLVDRRGKILDNIHVPFYGCRC